MNAQIVAFAAFLLLLNVVPAFAKAKGNEVPRNQALRSELLAMMKQDQEVRDRWINTPNNPQIGSEVGKIDTKNTTRMKQIVSQYGWPSISRVGKNGAEAVWLLVQHADADPVFQAHCLPLMKFAAEHGEANKESLALLTDRVLLAQGKKQIYGSQFIWSTGTVEPKPLENPAHVDERRKAMGMMPLAEYQGMLIQAYKLDQPKK